MSTVTSLEAEFKAEGVQEVKNGFAEIAKAAKATDEQLKQFSKDQTTAAKSYAAVEKQKAKEIAASEKELSKAQQATARETQAMYRQISAAALIAGAAVVKFGADSYRTYQDYAAQVRDLAKISGTGAVETSTLIQVLDDYQISAEQVTAATRFMTKQGLAPTIETLAKLSDQYNSLTSVQEKNAFVLKNLGRGGMAWINVLNQGGDAILENADDVNKWLIMTDEQIKNSEKARLAIDEVTDAWEGAKVQVGAWIGEIIVANKKQEENNERWDDYAKMLGMTGPELEKAGASYSAFTAQMDRGAAATEYYQNMVAQMNGTQEENIEITDQQLQLSFQLTEQTTKYQDSMDKLTGAITEQQKEVDRLMKAGYSPMGKTLTDAQKKLEELKQAAEDAGQSQVDAAEGTVSALLQVAGAENSVQLAFALATGQITQDAYDQALGMQAITQALIDEKVSAEQAAAMTQLLLDKLKGLDGMQVTAYINLIGGGGINLDRQEAWDYSDTRDSNPPPPNPPSNQYNNLQQQWDTAETRGGNAGGQLLRGVWTLVGDAPGGRLTPYSELISPSGHVFNAEQTRRIMKTGRIKPVSRALSEGEGWTNTSPTSPIKMSPLPQLPKELSETKINPSTGEPGEPSAPSTPFTSEMVIQQMMNIAAAVVENVATPVVNGVSQQLASTTQLQILKTTESIRETKKTNDLLEAILYKVASDRGIASAVSEDRYKNS